MDQSVDATSTRAETGGMYRRVIVLAALSVIASCAVRPNGDLAEQARQARTPGEYAAVAKFYRQRAEQLRADAEQHTMLASRWANEANASSTLAHEPGGYDYYYENAADHCRRLATYLSQTAAEADALAATLELLARTAR